MYKRQLLDNNLQSNSAFKHIPKNSASTVSQLQSWLISYITIKLIPEFPNSFSHSENHIKLSKALFCITGSNENNSSYFFLSRCRYALRPVKSIQALVTKKLTGRGFADSIFEEFGFSKELVINPNSLRHWNNTIADLSDIPISIITAWSGRLDPEQTHTYIHTSEEQKADRLRRIINPSTDLTKESILVISAKELNEIRNVPATITSTGICTQELNVTPCNYLNDFISQCVMCRQSCHIAGDINSINLLEKDYDFQKERLELVKSDPRLPNSTAMQDWYILHTKNTSILFTLINLMKEHTKGTVIHFTDDEKTFTLTDLKTKNITKISFTLASPEKEIIAIIERERDQSSVKESIEITKLLGRFGLETKV